MTNVRQSDSLAHQSDDESCSSLERLFLSDITQIDQMSEEVLIKRLTSAVYCFEPRDLKKLFKLGKYERTDEILHEIDRLTGTKQAEYFSRGLVLNGMGVLTRARMKSTRTSYYVDSRPRMAQRYIHMGPEWLMKGSMRHNLTVISLVLLSTARSADFQLAK